MPNLSKNSPSYENRPAQNKLVLWVASDQTLFKIDFKLGVDLPPVLSIS